jgi:hypothetical protein
MKTMLTKPVRLARLLLLVCIVTQASAGQASRATPEAPAPAPASTPATSPSAAQFRDGRLAFPVSYREWVWLSSGLDMSYSPQAMTGHSMFDNVFAEPGAYHAFLSTGKWPDGTVLVLEVRGATDKGSINRSGKFQTADVLALEVHLKDTRRFAGGWGFFAFAGGAAGGRTPPPAAQIPAAADCYSCHRDHAFVDTTFVQFYPTLLAVARQQGTVRAGQ